MDDAIRLQPNTFMDIIGPSAKTTARSKPHKSNTLMRTAVKRPDFGITETRTNETVVSSINNFHSDLSQSADLTGKSPLVSHYSTNTGYAAMDPATTFETPVEPEQVSLEPSDAEPMSVALEQPSFNIFKGVIPSDLAYSQPARSEGSKWDFIRRISGWSVLGIVVIAVLGGGLFINRNFSRVELYFASSKAGFSATLPHDGPAGYDLSSMSTGSGAIEASYKSNTDNREYTINEKQYSSSSSQIDAYVQSQAGMNFQAINTEGKTIYVYGGHNATWTNNGIWYIIQDNNSLSDHQIINIADSM